MKPFLTLYGNPSSTHAYARPCKAAVDLARARVARLVCCSPEEVVFTSCGSESDNWAVLAGIDAGKRMKGAIDRPHVITSSVEHPAVIKPLQDMANKKNIDLTVLPVDEEGLVSIQAVEDALIKNKNTVLVSIMHSNNEVGSIQPIPEIAALCRKYGVLLHTDAAQSVGKVPIQLPALGCDMITIVGHKFGCYKGIAALIVRKGVKLDPLLLGGGQEGGMRAGTENVLLITALGKASELVDQELEALGKHMTNCTDLLRTLLVQHLGKDDVQFNGPRDPSKRLPNTVSASFRGITRASALVARLSDHVALSAGSACHSTHDSPSGVLVAMGIPTEQALGTLRISTGRHTTRKEVIKAAEYIARAVRAEREAAAKQVVT